MKVIIIVIIIIIIIIIISTSLKLFSFVEEIASPSRGWREGGLSSYKRVI